MLTIKSLWTSGACVLLCLALLGVASWPVAKVHADAPLERELTAAEIGSRPPLVTAGAEKAIEKGVEYLAKTQSKNGSWRTNGSEGGYPVAMTSMAGLALMAAGNSPTDGPYADNVRKAVNFLLASADKETGLIASLDEAGRPMYGHGFAMLFLAQAYGMERDPEKQEAIRQVLEKAIVLSGRAQSDWGGWYYGPNRGSDEGSVTITQVQGLRAARNAGINVPKKIIDESIKYLEKSANPDGGMRYTARSGGRSLPAITAQAVAALYNAGEYEHPVAKKALNYVKNLMRNQNNVTTAFGGHSAYATFYAGQAMYLSGDDNWDWYYPKLRDHLVRTQNKQDGSWNGDHVGTTYGTACHVVVLALPYNYLPIFQR
jgi:hypothetical protein